MRCSFTELALESPHYELGHERGLTDNTKYHESTAIRRLLTCLTYSRRLFNFHFTLGPFKVHQTGSLIVQGSIINYVDRDLTIKRSPPPVR